MGQPRGYARVMKMLAQFLEEHGFQVKLGAWVDVYKDGKLYCDLQVGHWSFHRPPRRGARYDIMYLFTEGKIKPHAKEWLKGYDYILVPAKWIKVECEKLDLHCELMYVGIDTQLFRPLNVTKWIDVLSVGIWESKWDDRKFMKQVIEVAFPYSCYVHTHVTIPYEQLPLLYNSAKLYVSLSACEAVNIPVLEACACGIPVVYNKAPGTEEYAFGIGVNPVKIYDVEIGIPFWYHEPNIPKIREVVHQLLKDEHRLIQLGMQAREHALKFDYRKTFRILLEILK